MLRADTPQGRNDSNATSVDLNTLVQQGVYEGIGVTVTNGPTGDASTEFSLLVHISGSTVTQTLTDKVGTFFRSYNGTVWTAWAVYYTVATLPSASANPYMRTFVTDANALTFGSIVAGGGTNIVPVYSNGTNWVIG